MKIDISNAEVTIYWHNSDTLSIIKNNTVNVCLHFSDNEYSALVLDYRTPELIDSFWHFVYSINEGLKFE
jgi:hypothetical protein